MITPSWLEVHLGGATSGTPAQMLPAECCLDPDVEFSNDREEADIEGGAHRAEGPKVVPLLVMPRLRPPAVPRRPSNSLQCAAAVPCWRLSPFGSELSMEGPS